MTPAREAAFEHVAVQFVVFDEKDLGREMVCCRRKEKGEGKPLMLVGFCEHVADFPDELFKKDRRLLEDRLHAVLGSQLMFQLGKVLGGNNDDGYA